MSGHLFLPYNPSSSKKKSKFGVPMLCILNVGTVPMLCILYVGTVPTLCILNVGTVPTFSHSHEEIKFLKKILVYFILIYEIHFVYFYIGRD